MAEQREPFAGVRPDQHGGGFFQIRVRHSGKCLMLDREQQQWGNGTRVAQYPCPSPAQKSAQWSFEDMNGSCDDNALCIDGGRRIVRNRYTGRCLDSANAAGRKPPQQAILQQWTCIRSTSAWNADNQIWKLWDPVGRRAVTRPV